MNGDAHSSLGEALLKIFAPAALTASRQKSWASATFAGARHFYTITADQHVVAAQAARLACGEFTIGRHLVADICIAEQQIVNEVCELQIEALTVDEV